jgi:serine/threonine protein phosphatase PrpC
MADTEPVVTFEPLDGPKITFTPFDISDNKPKVEPEITFEPLVKSSISTPGAEMRKEGSVDFAYYGNGGGIALCTGEETDGSNQDAAGIREGDKVALLVVSDGVSQSYEAQLAAQEVTRVIVERGTIDLTENVRLALEALRDLNLPPPSEDLSELMRSVQTKRFEESGSRTTLLQLKVNKESGVAEGVFVGDGAVVIVDRYGKVKRRVSTMDKSGGIAINRTYSLGTKGGDFGQPSRQRFVLGDGETIMLCSDGATDEIIGTIASQVAKPGRTTEEVAKRVALILDQHKRTDDVTVAMYTHKRETLG